MSDNCHSTDRGWCSGHEFTEDVNDASMCVCGIPALTHDAVYLPEPGAQC